MRVCGGELWASCDIGGGHKEGNQDAAWAKVQPHVRARLNWIEVVSGTGFCTVPGRVHDGLNSGYQAIGLAAMWGAAKIVLLGYDMQRGPDGESHDHGDHEGGLPNLGHLDQWAAAMGPLAADLSARGVDVINASRATAITAFERLPLEQALHVKPPLVVQGMLGLGDNLHQRAIVRQLMQTRDVWLETTWPCVYHDLPVHLLPRKTMLRTQAKNAQREAGAFTGSAPPRGTPAVRVHYPPAEVRARGSVLAAMAASLGLPAGDFRMPVPTAWQARADAWLEEHRPDRPLLIYRPLMERSEWSGCRNRNPDARHYAELLAAIRDRYWMLSVADLVPGKEWLSGTPVAADAECHAGELDVEILAGLFRRAALVFASPGFAVVLAQAVGTPVVSVVGGYEDGTSFAAGARYSPTLVIEPITPCACWSHTHACNKRIDMPKAIQRLREFIGATADQPVAA